MQIPSTRLQLWFPDLKITVTFDPYIFTIKDCNSSQGDPLVLVKNLTLVVNLSTVCLPPHMGI